MCILRWCCVLSRSQLLKNFLILIQANNFLRQDNPLLCVKIFICHMSEFDFFKHIDNSLGQTRCLVSLYKIVSKGLNVEILQILFLNMGIFSYSILLTAVNSHMTCYNLTGLKSSYEWIISSFLVLQIISCKARSIYSNILQD